ncbi:uncharacterized protein LOC133911506 [Phragmites australis]|uniref:uncharacterized protein LOC133911506 n=1 Tax=Phragmites australis TaxID=29695 RepID=UPI002D781992|nr:uncharacterized protein LOC133911506 [Phragmites australis]
MAKTRKPPPPPPPPPPAETPSPQRRRKKKGRPSLLDLQRRSLRLQAQNPSPDPAPSRRDPNPSDDDDDGAGSGRRRQKRLKSVLSGSVKEESGEGKKDAAKATGKGDAASDGGPTGTPLPDKKLLLFILDRLQKKDTYGVFSEPVDPEELPDYHEIIEHPMDFSTIREKLLNDSYSTLEQFENDVFLLTLNAMSYNSADTIYYRQARSIEALAKKDFENLRQPSDEEDEQPKPARRGRPPKNPKVEDDVSPDLSNVKANKHEDNAETIRKRLTGDRTRNTNTPTKDSSTFHSMLSSSSVKRTDKIGDYSGSSKWGKKPTSLDDDRRSTYDQHYSRNSSLFAALDDERKLLVPVGLQQQYAYARSVARFAAKLGSLGWDIAANRIRRTLPPGANFGPGWVLDGEPPQNSQWAPIVASTNSSSQSTTPPFDMTSKNDVLHHKSGLSSNGDVTGEEHLTRTQAVASTSAGFDKRSEIASKVIKYENGANKSCGMDNTGPAPPLQHNQSYSREMHSNVNGFTAVSNTISQYAGQGIFGSGIPMTHAQVLGMFSGVNGRANSYIHGHPLTAGSVKIAQNGDVGKATPNPVQDPGHDPKIVLPPNANNSAPPNLNAGVQSSSSPPRGKVANPKQPDLALQL